MSKVNVTGKESKFNPIPDQLGVAQALGLTPTRSGNEVFSVDEQQDQTNSFSGIKLDDFGDKAKSLYSSDSEALPLLNEQRAQDQGATEQLIKGLGRIGTTIGTEILKTPGYIGGAVMGALPGNSMINSIVDNNWVNAMESLDAGIKEAMPVYLTKEVEEGNIGNKLLSSAWWSTTGADGIGFLLSMYVPGQAVKALGAGAKIGAGLEALAAETKLSKVLTASKLLKTNPITGVAEMTAKGIANVDSGAAVVMNTYVESASEAANTFDTVKKSYLQANPNATEEELNAVAGNAAAGVMKANVGTLLLSNYLDELFLFKGFGRSAESVAKDSMFGRLLTNGKFDAAALGKLSKEGVKDFLKGVPKGLGANFLKEGLFEEGLQSEIQQHYEDQAAGKTKAGFFEDVVGNYFEDLFTDPKMQESVVLGGILGGGASMVSTAVELKAKNEFLFGKGASTPSFFGKLLNKKPTEATTGFANLLKENFVNSFRTIHDLAETNTDGKPIYENGKIKLSEEKLKQAMDQKTSMVTLNQLHNIAILNGNEAEQDQWGDLLTFNYFLPFLQQEGGYEVLKGHISDQIVELMAAKNTAVTGAPVSDAQKETLKAKLLSRAESYNKIFEDVKNTTNTETSVRVDDPSSYTPWNDSVRNRKLQSAVAFDSANRRLAEIANQTLFGQELNDDQLEALSPQDLLLYAKAKLDKIEYGKRSKLAKDEYMRLSTPKSLREDYENFKKSKIAEAEELTTAAVEANKDLDDKKANMFSSADFEAKINAAGYDTKKSDQVKGFYLDDQRILLQDKDGKRATLEAVYNATSKTVEYVTKDASGKVTAVTDANGIFTPAFIAKEYAPISKEQITQERTALAITQRREAQLALLDEFMAYRNSVIDNHQKEIESINAEIEQYDKQLTEAKEQVAILYAKKIANQLPKSTKQQKIDTDLLQNTVDQLTDTINNLVNRRTYLEGVIPRIQALVTEYAAIRQMVVDNPRFSFKNELASIEKQLIESPDSLPSAITDIQSLINDINSRIAELEAFKLSIENTIKANDVFVQMVKLNEDKYTEAFTALDNFMSGIPLPYTFSRIQSILSESIPNALNGDTLLKNNLITNAEAIADWFSANPDQKAIRLGEDAVGSVEEIYDKLISIMEPYSMSTSELAKQSWMTPEMLYSMQADVLATTKEIKELTAQLVNLQDSKKIQDLYRRYLALEKLVQTKVQERFTEINQQIGEKNIDNSQKQPFNATPEQGEEASMRKIFMQHALPQTPFSTTGVSVLYEKSGARRGKDKIDTEGFPVLNDNEFQRLWFLTIDKLSDNIGDYVLKPIHAKYDSTDIIKGIPPVDVEFTLDEDSGLKYRIFGLNKTVQVFTEEGGWSKSDSRIALRTAEVNGYRIVGVPDVKDDYQKVIEANFPNVADRTSDDVFVFLTDKAGKPIRVDKQGNQIENGTFVFTSVRKADEVFPNDSQPRVNPDYILNTYLNSIGINSTFSYEKIKSKPISEFIVAPKAKAKVQSLIDNGGTGEDLFRQATAYNKQEYITFVESLKNPGDLVLKVDGVSKGYPLYQVDNKTGKRVKHKVLDTYNDKLKLQPKKFGRDQLQGGKFGVIVNSQIKSGDRFISLPEGTAYIQFDNDDFVTLESRNINEDENRLIMYLLSLANSTVGLNTITVPLPKKKDGSNYYYQLGNQRIEGSLPVFFRKTQTGGQSFSLLETLINYGLRSKDKNKKGEIYIDKGKVVFTGFDGMRNEVSLTDISAAIKSNEFEKYNDAVANLFEFLSQKRVNVHNTLLANNPIYFYPKLKRNKNGDHQIDFDTNSTYYKFLLDDVVTTSATRKESYPERLQRNIIYNPKLTKVNGMPIVQPEQASKPPEVVVAAKETREEIIAKQVRGLSNATKEMEEADREKVLASVSSNTVMQKRFEDAGYQFDPTVIDNIVNGVRSNFTVTTPSVIESTPVEATPAPKMTAKERLAVARGEATKALNFTPTPSADKIVDENIIEYYIKNNIVQRECK